MNLPDGVMGVYGLATGVQLPFGQDTVNRAAIISHNTLALMLQV